MEDIKHIRRFPNGRLAMPPSKSLSHRAVICAALAARDSGEGGVIRNLGESEDISATMAGMCALGAHFTQADGIWTASRGAADSETLRVINCGESGSTLRFLLPLAALDARETRFIGRGQLPERPLEVYEALFRTAGVQLRRDAAGPCVRGPLKGGDYTLAGHISSQFLSGLLFALPLAEGDSVLRLETPLQSRQYADLTLDTLHCFGIEIAETNGVYRIRGGQHYRAADYAVEGDYSQAAFFLGAAALGQSLCLDGLKPESLQGDRAILDILADMGAPPLWEDDLVRVSARPLRAVRVDMRDIPDLAPPVAALCACAEGESLLYNAERLRFKECDRLHVIAEELAKLGADIEEGEDFLRIRGKAKLAGGAVHAHNDHRIAMMCALAAIRCTEPVRLTDWQSVRKSYPRFWEDFEKGEA